MPTKTTHRAHRRRPSAAGHGRCARTRRRGWKARAARRARTTCSASAASLGNEELRAPVPGRPGPEGGWPTYLLPRTGEAADALGPLPVECFTGPWPNPDGPGRVLASHVCSASSRMAQEGVRVTHRFQREIRDEPDWQALDLGVRQWIAARRTGTEQPR